MNTILMISLAIIAILGALAFATHCYRAHGLIAAANAYDAETEVHTDSVRRTNDAAIAARHLLYKKGAGDNTVAVSGATDIPIGTIDNIETAVDMGQTVLLLGSNTTRKMVCSEAIGAGVPVFAAASGKIATGGTVKVGVSLTAGAADDAVIEVASCIPVVVTSSAAIAATRTILASENGKTFFFGHATEFAMTLPSPTAGLRYRFRCTAAPSGANYTIVAAGAATIIIGQVVTCDFSGTVDSDFGTAGENAVTFVASKAVAGDWCELEADGTNWHLFAACSVFDAITLS